MWDLPGIRDQTPVPCISRQILIHCTTRKVWHLSYLTCWFEKHNVVNSPYLCRKCLEKIRNKTSSKYTKFASILYSTQRMEWNLPWAKLKNCFFSLSDTFSCVFGKAERRTWTDSLQLQIYASNISLANGIILWLFFQREKKKKDFLLQATGWGLFGYPFVSTCRQLSLLFVLFAMYFLKVQEEEIEFTL